jgi:hypothetical protein
MCVGRIRACECRRPNVADIADGLLLLMALTMGGLTAASIFSLPSGPSYSELRRWCAGVQAVQSVNAAAIFPALIFWYWVCRFSATGRAFACWLLATIVCSGICVFLLMFLAVDARSSSYKASENTQSVSSYDCAKPIQIWLEVFIDAVICARLLLLIFRSMLNRGREIQNRRDRLRLEAQIPRTDLMQFHLNISSDEAENNLRGLDAIELVEFLDGIVQLQPQLPSLTQPASAIGVATPGHPEIASGETEIVSGIKSSTVGLDAAASVVDMCTICRDSMVAGQHVVQLPRCTHTFHLDCLRPWLELRNNCPTCRSIAMPRLD